MTVDAVAKSRWGKEDRVYFGPRPVDSGTHASPRRPPRDSQFASLSHCNLRFIIGLGLPLTRNVPSANGLTGNWAKAVNNTDACSLPSPAVAAQNPMQHRILRLLISCPDMRG
ncbi:hypothetical protein ASPTUDRAFT_58028 [Aspergillus tubingensis CBS 134.48]|uniref:Uncharacterized protein n=1 Tax=Aspergillus tubingensis (strain CBS 134.48) TaxID=767770 RepID=A0A1L9MZ83_ASPTC|nr:hypothetical protein ASPTUDRAFT_58028 [Aspergillus tubingensis CBS 134.48]